MYEHCRQLQCLPEVLAAGPAMNVSAYLLATCLLPVTPVSCYVSATQSALRAVKALHQLKVLHGDIRRSNLLNVSLTNATSDVMVIDLGHSKLCTVEKAFQEEIQQTRTVLACELSQRGRSMTC